MAGDPAELAYGHALAMLGDPDAASEVAIAALRRAGRARSLVLAHARNEAVRQAGEDPPVDLESIHTVVLDLPALAATLASVRPPQERAALDLRARTSGDLAALGDALGVRPSTAADYCADVAELWERTLDPALLAFSGPGDCEVLAELLGEHSLDTVADLVGAAPAVRAHVEHCTVCTDRVRAMASVRSFFSDTSVEVPPPVRVVSRTSRTKRPSAHPPAMLGFDATGPSRRRNVTPGRVAAALIVIVAASVGGAYAATRDATPGTLSRLTRLAKPASLTIGDPTLSGPTAHVTVENGTDKAVRYRASTSVAWAQVEPANGVIEAHTTKTLAVQALATAPEGEDRATLTVQTSSGASSVQELTWTLDRPPDIDASANGCEVSVNVVEEGKLTSLVLHWRDSTDHEVDLTEGPEGYEAMLAPNGEPVTYWVTAVDDRGNQARTADQVIPANAC